MNEDRQISYVDVKNYRKKANLVLQNLGHSNVEQTLLPEYMGPQLNCTDCPVVRYLEDKAPLPKGLYYKVLRGFAYLVYFPVGAVFSSEYSLEMPGPVTSFIRMFDALEYEPYWHMCKEHYMRTHENLLGSEAYNEP